MIATARAPWARMPKVSALWSIPRRQTVSEWSAENRILSEKESAEPGKWSNARAPYLTEIMDSIGDPEITDVAVMKAAQVGMSEVMRNVLGYWIANDPGPALWVMPDQGSAEEMLGEKLAPMIRSTDVLADHVTDRAHDIGKRKILLDNMEIHGAWAGSPQSLASRPKRYVVYDEADKYPLWSGKESDPIALGNKRRTTYGHRSKGVVLGTPTTRMGPIWKAFDDSPVKLRYHVACPHCGVFRQMAWMQVRWPKELPGTRMDQATAIDEQSLAWYECPACLKRVEESERRMMVARGVWCADGYETVNLEGFRVGKRPKSRKIAYHVPALLSPWVSWSLMASEFVAALGDESKLMDFRNSRLGEPYEIRAKSMKTAVFDEKIRAGYKPGIVPKWAGILIATADTQKDHFWYVIRAWGHGFRSRLIEYGRVETFQQLKERCLETYFPSEDSNYSPMAGQMLAIDSGGAMEGDDPTTDLNRTHQVYQFALSDPGRIFALKGWGGRKELESPMRQTFVAYNGPNNEAETKVALYHLKVGYFKDVLSHRISQPSSEPDSWELHSGVGSDYCRQMVSEHKVLLRAGRQQIARWVPVTSGAANHLWDAETYQVAASQIAHVETIPSEAELSASRRAIIRPERRGGDSWDNAVDWQ